MPKNLTPEDRWEVNFDVPLPGEPRNIGSLEVLFQRLLNRTERLRSRIADILGLPWDATPPDTLAGLAGRVSMLETSVSADPTPDTIARRNAQGAVQDGAVHFSFKVVKVGGIYLFGRDRWFRLARWYGFDGVYRGIFADLRIRHMSGAMSGTLRFRFTPGDQSYPFPLISVSNDTIHTLIFNAIVRETSDGTHELWIHCTGDIYVEGALGTITGNIALTRYGDVQTLTQDTPPTQEPGKFYLDWASALVDETFTGPGYIVSARRDPALGYIRYENGLQVAWGTISVGNGDWVFPAAFSSPPRVQATAQDSVPCLAIITGVSAVAASVLRTNLSGTTQFGAVHLYAVGLWK
jgi:hypothetical protein